LWPPRFIMTDDKGVPAIQISSRDRGATVRFTTDGSPPTPDSPVYREPISLHAGREIQACSWHGAKRSQVSVLRHVPAAGQSAKSLLVNGDFSQGTKNWRSVVSRQLAASDALEFTVDANPSFHRRKAARLNIKSSDGVPYHLRLVQPLQVPGQANLYVTAKLSADRPARVRFGIQERGSPYRVIHVGIVEISPEPRQIRWNLTNPHPDLSAQLQLDLGYCSPGTTVWLGDVTVHDLCITQ
jgi:hypothetical protein